MLYEKAKELLIKHKSGNFTVIVKALVEKWLLQYKGYEPKLSEEKMEETAQEIWRNLLKPSVKVIKSIIKYPMQTCTRLSVNNLAVTIILTFVYGAASGQLYPRAKAASPDEAASVPSLTNLNVNKSFKTKPNQDTTMNFEAAVGILNDNLHNDQGYTDAKHILQLPGIEKLKLRQAQNQEMEGMKAKLRTKEKENALKTKDQNILLLQQNNKLQEIRLKQSDLAKNIITVGIVALSVVTALLYKQYRNKQKANLVITKKSEVIEQKSAVILQKNEVITQKNRQLELLLKEKEWLLKEVHHRVKNNLQTVICLLESQAAYLENDALKAIVKSQNRIYTMSLIHQKLYQSEDIKTIDMASYIPELVQYLKDSFEISDQVYFDLHINQISLAACQAIPLALIINEALTNAIKYAFPDNRQGIITIALNHYGRSLRLEIADNGIGINSQNTGTASLGTELIKGLSKELKGTITFKRDAGVKIIVAFEPYILNYKATSNTLITQA